MAPTLIEPFNALFYGAEIGEHAAEPALVDIILSAAGGLFIDRVLSLLFRPHEEDAPSGRNGVLNKRVSPLEESYGFLQVNDIDAVTCSKDVGFHLGIPPPRLMAEVDSRFE